MQISYKETIRKNIREQMKLCGIKQVQLAELLGMTQANLSRVLGGKIPLSEDHIDRFARALSVDPRLFFKDVYPIKTQLVTPEIEAELQTALEGFVQELSKHSPEMAIQYLSAVKTLLVSR